MRELCAEVSFKGYEEVRYIEDLYVLKNFPRIFYPPSSE